MGKTSPVKSQGEFNSMETHLFSEWSKRIIEDDLFEGEEDEDKWMVDEMNAGELIEALNYNHDDWLTEDELLALLNENNESLSSNDKKIFEPSRKPWSQLKYTLFDLLVDEKKISFKDLIH